jgi:RNase P protein component
MRVAWRELRARTAPVDCVVVVRKTAVGAAFSELAGHLESCLRSLGVLATPTPDAALPARATGGSV